MSYVAVLVQLHGLDDESNVQTVAETVRTALVDRFVALALADDVEVDVEEHTDNLVCQCTGDDHELVRGDPARPMTNDAGWSEM